MRGGGVVGEYIRVARLYMIVLAIFTVGRLATGWLHVPYSRGHHVFSLVTLTLMAAAFYGAFCRKWRGYTVTEAMGVGLTIGILGQIVILLATLGSFALHADTYFVNPRAVTGSDMAGPVSFGQALGSRLGGAVINAIITAISAALGWVMGAVLPERSEGVAVASPPPAH
jgi:hypothetical protein